ncbi:MAG TPA: hypothetical protein VHB97_09310 [Polyangia bacterium]|nr:hypothetical protein [Polyangia bacterium]
MKWLALFVVLGLPAAAHAFDDATQFFANPTVPHGATYGASGEGIYFTGAPRFASLACNSCHTDGPRAVGLELAADQPELFKSGYVPGQTYELEVIMKNETKGTQYDSATCTDPPGTASGYVQCNNNNFGLEVDAAGVTLKGGFCAAAPVNGACPAPDQTNDEALVAPDGDAIFGNRQYDANTARLIVRNGPTTWHLWWTAPPIGSGPVTVYVTAVDGNGGAGTAANDQDPYDDDTAQASFFLQEAGASAPTGATAGCAFAATPTRASLLTMLLPLAALALRRRRSRRARRHWVASR